MLLSFVSPTFYSFLKLGQKYKNIFVRFLVQMKTLKFAFEIYWPLRMGSLFTTKFYWQFSFQCLLMPFGLFKALVRTKLIIYILFRTLKSRKCQQLDTCYPFESTNITSKCKCNVCFQKRNFFPNTCLKMLISNSFQTKNEN